MEFSLPYSKSIHTEKVNKRIKYSIKTINLPNKITFNVNVIIVFFMIYFGIIYDYVENKQANTLIFKQNHCFLIPCVLSATFPIKPMKFDLGILREDEDDPDDIILTQISERKISKVNKNSSNESANGKENTNNKKIISQFYSRFKNNPSKADILNSLNSQEHHNDAVNTRESTESSSFPPNEDLRFLQLGSRSKFSNKNKITSKFNTGLATKWFGKNHMKTRDATIDTLIDQKNSGTATDLEILNPKISDPEMKIEKIPDLKTKLEAIEKELIFKSKIMLQLQNKVFKSSKPERFGDNFSYSKASQDNDNGDDFVAYLGYLGDSVEKYQT